MSAKITGQDWSSILTIGLNVGGVVSISGNDGCNPGRALHFNLAPSGPGTYTMGPGDLSVLTATYAVGVGPLWDAQGGSVGGSGTVTFSTLTATAGIGTFSFTLVPHAGTTAAGTQTVTNGVFNVKFTVNPPAGGS